MWIFLTLETGPIFLLLKNKLLYTYNIFFSAQHFWKKVLRNQNLCSWFWRSWPTHFKPTLSSNKSNKQWYSQVWQVNEQMYSRCSQVWQMLQVRYSPKYTLAPLIRYVVLYTKNIFYFIKWSHLSNLPNLRNTHQTCLLQVSYFCHTRQTWLARVTTSSVCE